MILSYVSRGGRGKERRELGRAANWAKIQKVWITKMAGL